MFNRILPLLLTSGSFMAGRAHPERDIFRLHRLFDHRQEMLAQLRQVNLVAQRCTECCYRAGSIILTAIEAMIDDGLNAVTQRLEDGRNHQGGDHDGNVAIGVDDAAQEGLQSDDAAEVNQGQYDCERAIDQRAIDEQVDVVESIAQNREPYGERDQEQGGGPDDKSNNKFTKSIYVYSGWDQVRDDQNAEYHTECYR